VSDLSNDATDDGFHEIQLSGKQLVFLFMATTVVSVVIFLCGVLVGRGVRGEALTANTNKPAMSTAGPTPTPTDAGPSVGATPPPSVVEDSKATDNDKLSYTDRLTSDKPAAENVKTTKPRDTTEAIVTPPPAQPAPVAAAEPAPKTATPPKGTTSTPAPPAETASKGPEPSRNGVWAVQVVALTDRAAAQAVVDRLSGKGYPAFLVSPRASAPVKNYKVQIGRFEDRNKALEVANKLKAEEQFEPWILR
jgi:cell division septation protein DedD